MSFWDRRTVLLTGATGFVGGHLTERLLREGACVRVLVRNPHKLLPELRDRVEVVRGDLLQPDCFAPALAGCDCVFHVAAWMRTPNRREVAYAVNVTATRQLAEAAREAGVRRFVGTSSIAVYGPVQEGVVDETWPQSDVYLYSETKSRGEQASFAVQTGQFGVTVLRPAQVFGPRGASWTTLPIQLARRGLPILIGGGEGLAHPVYVENLVDAYVLAAQREEAIGEAFTICDVDLPWREFFGRYAAMFARHPRSIPVWPAWCAVCGAEIAAKLTHRPPAVSRAMLGYITGHCTFSTVKAKRLLGWSPRFSFDEAISRTEAWLRTAGYLPCYHD